MVTSPDAIGPKVFISYAEPDKLKAERLVIELASHGINAFFAPRDTVPGENFVSRLSTTLADSDYFVLLVSAASIDRPWVELEWTTALARELNERRAFLFLLRLDDSNLPMLLSTRHYLDAYPDWDNAVGDLISVWKRDWNLKKQNIWVLPAPSQTEATPSDSIGIYIYNDAFSVQHFMRIQANISGRQLYAQVKSGLVLKDQVEAFGGQIGMRFSYLLLYEGSSIQLESSLDRMGIKDGVCLDMQVTIEQFGPSQDNQIAIYRYNGNEAQIPQKLANRLIQEAFGHLV